MTRKEYQLILNKYAKNHERSTTMDFHHLIKGCLLDAVDDGILKSDPTRRAIIKGKTPHAKKKKFLSLFELQLLLKQLNLGEKLNWDWFILLIAKTGLRYAEAVALTPEDFDFQKQTISINKTWDYKNKQGGFQPTKNESSVRTIPIDWQLNQQFASLIVGLPDDKPIFVKKRVYNSTVNKRLEKLCNQAGIPVISVHSLRHTHASLLLYSGVSIASVSKRLGHSSMVTTQETYLHVIKELENQDNDKIMRHLASLI